VGNSSQTTLAASAISLGATATGILVSGTGQFTKVSGLDANARGPNFSMLNGQTVIQL
jgi:hypothetical protein